MKKIIFFLLSFQFILHESHAQNSINPCGIESGSATGSVSATIGQVFYTTSESITGSVAEGVQHPFEVYVMILENGKQELSISAYPNPTAGAITLSTKGYSGQNGSWQLSDFQGKLILQGLLQNEITNINTTDLSNSIYFLKVYNQENETIQIFKIIKH